MKTLGQILKRNSSKSIFSWIGLALGFLFILISVKLKLDLSQINQTDSTAGNEGYITVNKQIGLLNALNDASVKFSQNELDEIIEKDWVIDASGFTSNNYRITLSSSRFNFRTELFFESVKDHFIDTKTKNFTWNKEDNLLPVILSNQFYNLYNFGFAAGQGMPKVPKEVLMGLQFDLRVSEGGKYRDLKLQVVGFSDRISSIIVPNSFMLWANNYFGEPQNNYSRLILKVKDLSAPELPSQLNQMNLEMNQELLGGKAVNKAFNIITAITSSFGLFILILSINGIIYSIKYQVIKQQKLIKTLRLIGYNTQQIVKETLRPIIKSIIIILFLVNLIISMLTYKLNEVYYELGLTESNSIITTVVISLLLGLIVLGLSRVLLKKELRDNQ